MRRPLRSLCAVLAVLGCGDDPRPPPLTDDPRPLPVAGCEAFDHRPCDVLEPACQAELFGLVACLRGEDELDEIPVQLLAEDEAATFVMDRSAESTSAEQQDDFRSEVRGLELLGLLEPGLLQSEADVVEATLASVLAFYLTTTQEIVIIDRGAPLDDVEASMTLAHEIVHALQDRRHGLGQVSDDFAVDTDSDLALAAVVEGEASFYEFMLRVAFEGMRLEDVDVEGWFATVTRLAGAIMLESSSPMLAARGIFPYSYGARFVAERWLEGRTDAIDVLYLNPPAGTREVMVGALSGRADMTAPRAPAGHALVSEDTAGAWLVGTLAAQAAKTAERDEELVELGAAWRGDHLWIYRSTEGAPAVTALWAMEFADEQTAATVADLLASWVPEGARASVVHEGAVTRLVATESDAELDAWQQAFGP